MKRTSWAALSCVALIMAFGALIAGPPPWNQADLNPEASAHHTTVTCNNPETSQWKVVNSEADKSMTFTSPQGPSGAIAAGGYTFVTYNGTHLKINGIWSNGATSSDDGYGDCFPTVVTDPPVTEPPATDPPVPTTDAPPTTEPELRVPVLPTFTITWECGEQGYTVGPDQGGEGVVFVAGEESDTDRVYVKVYAAAPGYEPLVYPNDRVSVAIPADPGPCVTEPPATDPPTTDPTPTDPPATTDPTPTDPPVVVTDPPATDPPVVTDPRGTDPAVTDPAVTDPATTTTVPPVASNPEPPTTTGGRLPDTGTNVTGIAMRLFVACVLAGGLLVAIARRRTA